MYTNTVCVLVMFIGVICFTSCCVRGGHLAAHHRRHRGLDAARLSEGTKGGGFIKGGILIRHFVLQVHLRSS